jgi:tetratricopeptide (TPR) repeat protein
MSYQFDDLNNEGIGNLLANYHNLLQGFSYEFIDEDGFEQIIDYYDDKDDLAAALQAVDTAIGVFPYSAHLLLKKADLLIALKMYRNGLVLLKKVAAINQSEPSLYILMAEAHLALENIEEAEAALKAAAGQFDGEERIDVIFEISDLFDEYEYFDLVFDCMVLILKTDPNNQEALHKICFWTDFTGRNEESIHLHQAIIEEQPFNEIAWFNLGTALQGLKLFEKCIDAYQYAVAINEKFDFAYRNMGDAYLRLRQYKNAIEVLQKAQDLSKPEDVIYEAIAHCYYKLNDNAAARLNYRKAIQLTPENSRLYFRIACTYMNETAWENAIKNLEAALHIDPMIPEYNLSIGQCLMEAGHIEDAVQYFGLVVKMKPKSANGWSELLRCLYNARCFEEGLEYTQHALVLTNLKPVFYVYKAAFLMAIGMFKESLIELENALQLNPRLIKKLVELNPAALQYPQIVELAARYKKYRPAQP